MNGRHAKRHRLTPATTTSYNIVSYTSRFTKLFNNHVIAPLASTATPDLLGSTAELIVTSLVSRLSGNAQSMAAP